MKTKLGSIVRIFIFLLFICVGVIIGILVSNPDYFFPQRGYCLYQEEQLEFINWGKQDEIYVSQEDSQIILDNVNTYVREIKLNGEITGNQSLIPRIYYTENPDEAFTEEKSVSYTMDAGQEMIFSLGKTVFDLRIDLTEGTGASLQLDSIELNPQPLVQKTFLPTQIQLYHWANDGEDTYRSAQDSQIILEGIDTYVDQILIEGKLLEGTLDPHVYYTSTAQEVYSEANSFVPDIRNTKEGLLIQIGKTVENLRIDLLDAENASLQLKGIQVNPRTLEMDYLQIFFWALIMAAFAIPVCKLKTLKTRISVYLVNFKKYRYLLQDLVLRDIKIKYRRSILGIVWSVLNPLLMMLVTTAVFQNLFRFNIKNFPIYYLTGILIFNFVAEATSGAMVSVIGAGALIRKVYIPKYIFPLEKCLFAFVNMAFSLIATVIMLLILQVDISWTILLFWVPLVYALIFSVGLGLILASFNVFFRDIGHLYSVWTTAWMYLTPIIYPMEILNDTFILPIVKLNPLYFFVDYFRQVVMYGTLPSLYSNMMCLIYSMVFLILGLLVFKKKQDRFILYI